MISEPHFGYTPDEYEDLERRMHVIEQQSQHVSHDERHAKHRPRYEGVAGFQEETEKQKRIDELCEKRRLAFEKYFSQEDAARQSFEGIPQEALEYLIPKRLLEIMPDPGKVQLIVSEQTAAALEFFITKQDHFTGRDTAAVKEFVQELRDAMYTEQPHSAPNHPLPPDVPLFDLHMMKHTDEIRPNDLVCFMFRVERNPTPRIAFVDKYQDHEGIRNRGVSSESYQRMEALLTALKFDYITGNTSEEGYSHFFRKHERLLLHEAPASLEKELEPQNKSVFSHFSYKRLTPPKENTASSPE